MHNDPDQARILPERAAGGASVDSIRSDGNVSVHARKLEDAGYITCTKGFEGRVPRTEYRLAPAGRLALEQYLAHMEALIRRVGGN